MTGRLFHVCSLLLAMVAVANSADWCSKCANIANNKCSSTGETCSDYPDCSTKNGNKCCKYLIDNCNFRRTTDVKIAAWYSAAEHKGALLDIPQLDGNTCFQIKTKASGLILIHFYDNERRLGTFEYTRDPVGARRINGCNIENSSELPNDSEIVWSVRKEEDQWKFTANDVEIGTAEFCPDSTYSNDENVNSVTIDSRDTATTEIYRYPYVEE